MKYLNKYNNLFEAKAKINWLEKYNSKVKELRDIVYSNPVLSGMDNKDMFNDLILPLKDIATGFDITVGYDEYIRFESDKEYEYFKIGEDGELFLTDSGRDAYREYTTKTKWLDKKRVSGKEIESYYVVFINTSVDLDGYYKFMKTKVSKEEWISEIKDIMEFLKSLGFKVEDQGQTYPETNGSVIKATIKLAKTDESTIKTLDLSDIVDSSIVADFERFILKKNLSRVDAEEIAKIFNKK